jgi:hypothetical protein
VASSRRYLLFGPDGALLDPQGPEGSAKAVLDQLEWWGAVLRDTRRDRPVAAR